MFTDIIEVRNDLDKVSEFIAKLCINNPEIAAKYDELVVPLSKAYYDAFGSDKFGYSSMLFGLAEYKFEMGQEYYGHLLTIAYGPAGSDPKDPISTNRHAFILVMDKGKPVDFVEIKKNTILH